MCRRGALFGESRREYNQEPVLYGLLRDTDAEGGDNTGDSALDNAVGNVFLFYPTYNQCTIQSWHKLVASVACDY